MAAVATFISQSTIVFVALTVLSCGPKKSPLASTKPGNLADTTTQDMAGDDKTQVPAPPPLREAVARTLLNRRFREHGLRIVEDVELMIAGKGITVDGFDPARKVGFEYIDPRERGQAITSAQRAALPQDIRLLIVGPTAQDALVDQTDAFLDAIPTTKRRENTKR